MSAAVAWGLMAYGLLGALCAVGCVLAVGLSRRLAARPSLEPFALGLSATLFLLGTQVGAFRIVRDVFLEQVPRGPLALAARVGAYVVCLAVMIGLYRVLRPAGAGNRLLTRAPVAFALIALAAGGLGVLGTAHGGPAVMAPRAPGDRARLNVVLLMADTLRADHLGCYGYPAIHTPRIDALAADGVRFANTFAQASWTRPSVATILTGLYPSSHGAIHKADALPDRVDTLAEILQRAGYRTVGFANNANISPTFNFQQGFDRYEYLAPEFFFHANEAAAQLALYGGLRLVRERFLTRALDVHNYYQPAEVVTAKVRDWLNTAGDQTPFFLFVHYMDAHDPYFVHPFNGEGKARVANPNPALALAAEYRRLYDGEIVYLDQYVGALLEELRRRGLYDHTLVVLTADHGEEFAEHGGWWHGTTLYDEQIRVPLIIKPARHGDGHVVEALATSLDIAPTILVAAGVPVPAAMQGQPLPLDATPPPARERIFAEEDLEGNVLRAVRSRQWKLIEANPDNPRGLKTQELYDLPVDPGEQHDVAAGRAPERELMQGALRQAAEAARAQAGATEQRNVDGATNERLRALGYVQ